MDYAPAPAAPATAPALAVAPPSLLAAFAAVPDPLPAMLALKVAAILARQLSQLAIAERAARQGAAVLASLGLVAGRTPCQSTIQRRRVGLRVRRARHLGRPAETAQVLPALLRPDRAVCPLRRPGRHRRAAPGTAPRCRAGEGRAQVCPPRHVKQRGRAGVLMSPVAHAIRPSGVIAVRSGSRSSRSPP